MTLINFREYKVAKKNGEILSKYNQFKEFCGFCGKLRDEVNTLIVGPGVCICDKCVAISHEIIKNDGEDIPD